MPRGVQGREQSHSQRQSRDANQNHPGDDLRATREIGRHIPEEKEQQEADASDDGRIGEQWLLHGPMSPSRLTEGGAL
jgi:hypothetical protein